MTNSADPDQLASEEANWSGSTLFAKAEHIWVKQDQGLPKILGHLNPCNAESIKMLHPLLLISQSDYLIQVVDIISNTEWQTAQIQISWLLRSQLIWIYTVRKGGAYQGPVQPRLRKLLITLDL